ncbi:MAG: PAS domain-containing protein, partial [Bacteroidota bacterium]|nr:PAS domain-containing protein [Bacteroidota bacterium]
MIKIWLVNNSLCENFLASLLNDHHFDIEIVKLTGVKELTMVLSKEEPGLVFVDRTTLLHCKKLFHLSRLQNKQIYHPVVLVNDSESVIYSETLHESVFDFSLSYPFNEAEFSALLRASEFFICNLTKYKAAPNDKNHLEINNALFPKYGDVRHDTVDNTKAKVANMDLYSVDQLISNSGFDVFDPITPLSVPSDGKNISERRDVDRYKQDGTTIGEKIMNFAANRTYPGKEDLYISDLNNVSQKVGLSESDLVNALIENSPDLIYFKDQNCKYIRANHAEAEAIGFSDPNDVIGKDSYDFHSAEIADRIRKVENEILRTGKPVSGLK